MALEPWRQGLSYGKERFALRVIQDKEPMELPPDLNLLVTLDAILQQNGSITKAAGQLHVSVPAVSRSLVRIRRLFNDPLLVRSGSTLVLTTKAIQLRERLHELVTEVSALVTAEADGDLMSSERVFRIAAPDYLTTLLGSHLQPLLTEMAPNLQVSLLTEGLLPFSLRQSDIDLEVGIIRHVDPEIVIDTIASDRFVGIAREDHPIFDAPITLESYRSASHILHSRRGMLRSVIDVHLDEHHLHRHIAMSVSSQESVLQIVSSTDLISTCLENLSRSYSRSLKLRYFELPIELEPVRISLAWHPRHNQDHLHEWLRNAVIEVVATTYLVP